MVRNYVRKTLEHSEEDIENAIDCVEFGNSIRSASKLYKIPFETLRARVKGKCSQSTIARQIFRVFNDEQEETLLDYLDKAANVFYGLSFKEVRSLAFQYACQLKENGAIRELPATWKAKNSDEKPTATRDWLDGFIRRHPSLILGRPVQTSICRKGYKPVIKDFFDTYEKMCQSHQYNAADVWNVDETGLITVYKTKLDVAPIGPRCGGSKKSGECGTNVTMALAVSAAGNRIPPFFIYPRKKFLNKFLLNGTTNARGVANGSGWQTNDTFLKWLQHFKDYAIRSSTKRTLLIMDNHESHMTIDGLDFCKANNIDVLTIPAHTSHRMQPLDREVFGPLKRYFDHSCNAWMRKHPGVPITIDRIAELVAEPLLKGASTRNIVAGFRSTGIWPFNRDVFSENQEPGKSNARQEAGTSNASQEVGRSSLNQNKTSNQGRKRRKAAPFTDSVMLESLRAERAAAAKKKRQAAKQPEQMEKERKLNEKQKENESIKNDPKRKRDRPTAKLKCTISIPHSGDDEDTGEVIRKTRRSC